MAAGRATAVDKAVAQYLSRHAEPEAALADRIRGEYGHVLVVPAYSETESLFRLLASVPGGPAGPVLIVLVLNARRDSPPEAHAANAEAADRLARELPTEAGLSPGDGAVAYGIQGGTLLAIDRASDGRFLPEGEGVGLARKIGNDVAMSLFAKGRIASPWLHNTDADTLLTGDYFEQVRRLDPENAAAAIYFFDHRFEADPDLALAGRLYEISLRYYVLGLAWAGSPYAYQSMGSCLAIPPLAYARVRGFPKKNAAEDFYVLNKLAKVGAIERLDGAPLLLEGRPSDRVPFGTGRALRDLSAKRHALARFGLYHPIVFAHLAAWLRVLDAIARSRGDLSQALRALPESNPFFRPDLLEEAVERLGAPKAIADAVGGSSGEATLRRHLHIWFDGFRTRKLVHSLRDGGFSSLPWREALAEAPFTGLAASTEDDVDALRRLLADEERKLAAAPAGVPAMQPPDA